jgi:serine carboxypeptidase-like clade 2
MVFIEQPVGVGFSYGDRYSLIHLLTYSLTHSLTHSTVNINDNNDDNTALRNVQAVEAFFAKFPEYKSNEFYISGESYAGNTLIRLTHSLIRLTHSLPHSLTHSLTHLLVQVYMFLHSRKPY